MPDGCVTIRFGNQSSAASNNFRTGFVAGKKNPGNVFPVKNSNPEKLFSRSRNLQEFFLGKSVHALTRQPELFQTPENMDKTS